MVSLDTHTTQFLFSEMTGSTNHPCIKIHAYNTLKIHKKAIGRSSVKYFFSFLFYFFHVAALHYILLPLQRADNNCEAVIISISIISYNYISQYDVLYITRYVNSKATIKCDIQQSKSVLSTNFGSCGWFLSSR